MFLPILSAILGIIAFLPINFYPAGLVFLAPLFIFFLREQKLRRLILGTALFRLTFGLGTVYYTLEPIFWLTSLLIFFGLPISIWLIKKFSARFHSLFVIRYLLFIALPFLWTVFDLLQARYSLLPTYIITAGNSLGSSPFVGLAGIGGLVLLTFFAASINTLIAATIAAPPLTREEKKRGFILIGVIAILIFSAYFISQYRLQKNASEYDNLPNSLKIAAISTNEKFERGQFEKLKAELSGKQLDLIVFPEDIFSSRADLFDSQREFFQNLAKELNADIITVFDTISEGKKYNSAILFGKNGEIAGVHNKNRLTFIGEYWPFGDWRLSFYDWLAKKNPKIKNYAVFDIKNAYARGDTNMLKIKEANFAAAICLEIQYLFDIKKYRENSARFVVNPTSNRWIGKGAKHFLYISDNLKKIEAVWLKLPIVSGGVKDFAGIILPNGEAHFVDYENSPKNWGMFFGEIKY